MTTSLAVMITLKILSTKLLEPDADQFTAVIQSKLATSEVTFAAIFRPNFAVSELEKILLSSDDVDEFCNYKLESSDIFS